MSILCMKTRTCLLFATCIVGTLCVSFLWLIGDEAERLSNRPRWNSLFSETHQHLRELQENPHQQNRLSEVDPYLRLLGFEPGGNDVGKSSSMIDKDETSSNDVGNNNNNNNLLQNRSPSSIAYVQTFPNLSLVSPLIAVPVQSGQVASAWDLYNSVQLHAPAEWIVCFYDLNLGYYEKADLTNRCKNASGTNSSNKKRLATCQVRHLDWSAFPSHLSQYKLEAYRPLIIHDALNSSGAVFYLSPDQRFRDRAPDAILDAARRLGVVGWRLDDDSTSAVTHPKAFAFLGTDPQNYYFHHTIRGDRLLVYNTPSVRQTFMLPWLRCSLKLRCVSPLGAQDTGCRMYRKPLYLYSGCHRYDVAIMNVVLGLMYRYDSASYTVDGSEGKFISAQNDLTPSRTT